MDDLIRREDAIDAIHEDIDWLVAQGGRDLDLTECMERAKSILNNLPSAEPERKVGKWTEDSACEFCGFQPWYEHDIHILSFCPNCGADMRGEEE